MAIVQGIDTGSWRVRVATLTGSFRRFVLRDVMEMEASVGIGEALSATRSHDAGWDPAARAGTKPGGLRHCHSNAQLSDWYVYRSPTGRRLPRPFLPKLKVRFRTSWKTWC